MDGTNADDETPTPPARPRHSITSKAVPYGTEDMAAFFSDEWETPWEINHTVVPPR